MYDAGTAFLQVTPSFRDIQGAFEREAEKIARQVDEAITRAVPQGMREGVRQASRTVQAEGRRAGDEYANAFKSGVDRRVAAVLRNLPEIQVDADTSPADRAMAQLRHDVAQVRDVRIGVDVSQEDITEELSRIERELTRFGRSGQTIQLRTDAKQAAAQVRGLREFIEAEGKKVGGVFAASVRKDLDAAAKSFPEIRVTGETSQADRAVAALRSRIEALRDVQVGVHISQGEFFATLRRLRAEIERFERQDGDIELSFNARAALARIEAIRKTAEERYSGAFDATFKRRLQAAQDALGDVGVGANVARANAALGQIQARIKRLSGLDIDVDIPADRYMAELETLQAQLARVADDVDVNVRIRHNARAAMAEIQAALAAGVRQAEQEGERSGGAYADAWRRAIREGLAALPEVQITADTTPAQEEVAELRAALATLGEREIGVDLDAGEARAAIAELELRLRQLADDDVEVDVRTNLLTAAQRLAEFQDRLDRLDGADARTGLQQLADQADFSMSRLGFLISVGSSIGTAIVPAAAAAAVAVSGVATAASAAGIGVGVLVLGLVGVGKAVGALDAYQKDANKSATSLSGAENRVANAASAVGAAHRGLVRAERERLRAVEDLSKAQERARRQLEDMALAVKDNALAQRQAQLDLAEAKRELDKVMSNPRATEQEREQARITFDERTLQLERLGVQQKRLAADKAEADRKGVKGSEEVQAAQERILNATESVLSAQESLAQSQRSLAQAYQTTGTAGGEALDNLRDAMNELSPAGQRFARFIFGLKSELKALQFPAEEGLLPSLEQGIRNLLAYRPQLSVFVRDIAEVLGDEFVELTRQLESPVWRRFFGYISSTAGPAIVVMAEATSNAARGVAALVVALSPFNRPMGSGLIQMTAGFAQWAEELRNSTGLQRFLSYVSENGPVVIDFIRQLVTFIGRIVIAAAPVGSLVLRAFDGLVGVLNRIPIPVLTAFVAILGIMATVMLTGAAATALRNLQANLLNAVLTVSTRVQNAYNATLLTYQAAAGAATVRTGALGAAISAAAGASAVARAGLGALVNFLGGPYGIAIIAATVLIGNFVSAQQRVEQESRDAIDALGRIATAFENGGDAAVASLARQDRAVAQAIITLRQYGVTSRDVFRASQGDVRAQAAVLERMRDQVRQLRQEIAGYLRGADLQLLPGEDNDDAFNRKMREVFELERRIRDLQEQYDLANAATEGYTAATEESAEADRRAAAATETYGRRINALQGVYDVLTGRITDSTHAARLFRDYVDQVSGAAISATEAQEQMTSSQLDLRQALTANGTALDLAKAKTDEQRRAILASRDALEDALRASREKALADLESGVTLDEVTRANEERIRAILDEIPATERNTQVVKDLVEAYGAIPAQVKTEFSSDGAEEIYEELKNLQVAQYALSHQITLGEARQQLYAQPEYNNFGKLSGRKDGGYIDGPGGPRDDKVLIRASPGEYMIPAHVVSAYGVPFFDTMIGRRTPGYANGGLVGDPASAALGRVLRLPFPVSFLLTKLPTMAQLQAQFSTPGAVGNFPAWPSSPAAVRYDSGVWRLIDAMVKKSGIPNSFGNAYRPGDPLWHGSGRAVDYMGYNQDRLANYFMSMRPRVLELIHTTPTAGYYITRGVRKSSMGDQDELHRNHLHIAMDRGGWIEPGWNPPIWNGTGRPEPVLTAAQWGVMLANVRGGDGAQSGPTYNFTFKDSTLDASRLRAMQDREAVRSRIGRPR